MKKIIVGFSTRPGAFSSLIRFCTNSEVSHTYVRIPVPEYGESMVFQASGLQVNYTNYELFKEKSKVIEEYEIEVEDETYEYAELLRITESGKPYSFLTVLGFVWILAMKGLGISVANPFSDGSKSYICVELVCDSLGMTKMSEHISPEDLRRWCARYGRLIYKRV